MAIVTRRMLLLPYDESLQLEFVMLNCCAKNRAEMNGPHTVASAKQLFEKILDDKNTYSLAVLESGSRDYMGHIFISS
ncbi:COG1670 Acetyltransferases [Vibrio sp. B1FLJ16]|nr:COG1670 Acetyltransferases [Vibrio sp. B1FLJ16]CAE6913693.1 COG1670 Acetyltransferases [Vibrio sp. B1FLJ16]